MGKNLKVVVRRLEEIAVPAHDPPSRNGTNGWLWARWSPGTEDQHDRSTQSSARRCRNNTMGTTKAGIGSQVRIGTSRERPAKPS